jgi:nucleoside-diphosphate-sugar epimerase
MPESSFPKSWRMISGNYPLRGKRVLVTGAGGFLGKHLTPSLAKLSPSEMVLVSRHDFTGSVAGAETLKLDLFDSEATAKALGSRRFDCVFHLAGKIDQGIRPGVFEEQFRVHVQTTSNLIDALGANPLERFFHFGSSMEYGNAPYPQINRERELPLSAYGVSKLASTKIVLARTKSEGLPGVILRPFLVYGAGQAKSGFLQSAMEAARNGQEFATTQGGQTRDFTPVSKFVDDTLEIAALPASQAIGEIFNICTGVEIYVRDVIAILQERFPAFKPQIGALPYRTSEVMHSVGEAFRPWTAARTREALSKFLGGEQ